MDLVGWGSGTQTFGPQHTSFKFTKFIHVYFLIGLYLRFTGGKPKPEGPRDFPKFTQKWLKLDRSFSLT